MAVRATTPTTNVQTGKGWYQGRYCYTLTQRVNCTTGAPLVALGANLPAYSRVIECSIYNVIVPTVTGTATTLTANAIALAMYPVSNGAVTTPLTAAAATAVVRAANQSLSTNGMYTEGTLLAMTPGIGTSETNGRYRGVPIVARYNTNACAAAGAENPMPVAALLALVPANLTSGTIQVNGTSIATGFVFGTGSVTATTIAATVDVTLYYETYDDYPSMP